MKIFEAQSRRHIPALDGLRAIAIILVLLFHLKPYTFSIGWTGVLLFFVLSGYLITDILLEAKKTPGYFRSFYARRSLRIFPAYYLCMLIAALAVNFYGPLKTWVKTVESAGPTEWIYFLLYVQNYWLGWREFATPLSWPLGHTWTLAIEEQYYLIWPAIIYVLNRRFLWIFCLVLIVSSPAVRIWIFATTHNASLALLTLPGQCDALAMGALIAVVGRSASVAQRIQSGASIRFDRAGPSRKRIGFALVILLLFWSGLIVSSGWESYAAPVSWLGAGQNILFITIASLVFATLLLLSLDETSLLSKILSQSVLTHIGRISYGLYLYHVVIFMVVDQSIADQSSGTDFAMTIIVLKLTLLYGVAILSYRYFETPFLRLKSKFALNPALRQGS
jgi:peptidoglycan/LPS O-acetylase OafA/YrhL